MARINHADEAFQRALDEAGRGMVAAIECGPPTRRPETPACTGFGRGQGGGKALWDFAMQWTDDRTSPLARPASTPTGEPDLSKSEAAAIAEELGLRAARSPAQLASRWRDFVWRNHPDRQPADARVRAGARVAVANSLYDAARRRLAKAG